MTHIFVWKAENDWLHRKTRYKSTCNRNAAHNAMLVKLIDILNKSQTWFESDEAGPVSGGSFREDGDLRPNSRRRASSDFLNSVMTRVRVFAFYVHRLCVHG